MPGRLAKTYTRTEPEEAQVWELQFDSPQELAAARSNPEQFIRPLLTGLPAVSRVTVAPADPADSLVTTLGCYHTLDCSTH